MTSPTINHIYCPIFHFQLILVEVIVCVMCMCERATHWKLKRNIYRLFFVLVVVSSWRFMCRKCFPFFCRSFQKRIHEHWTWAHSSCTILFNKFSASKHKMDPIIKQIHNTHSLTIKGNSNHKNWMMLQRPKSTKWTMSNGDVSAEHWTEKAKQKVVARAQNIWHQCKKSTLKKSGGVEKKSHDDYGTQHTAHTHTKKRLNNVCTARLPVTMMDQQEQKQQQQWQ